MVIGAALGVMMEERPAEGTAIIVGEARSAASLLDTDGTLRIGALGALADTIGGVSAGIAVLPDRWCVTTSMQLRLVRARGELPLRMRSSVWRVGRNAVVTSADIRDASGSLVATAMLANAPLVPEHGPPLRERPLRVDTPPGPSLDDLLALRTVADGVELELRPELRNPWGILHGGVTGCLVEAAARRAGGGTPADTVVHFLRPGRVGPVHARPTVLGTRPDGTLVRTEVRDVGADRTMAVATTTVRQSDGA